MANEILVRMRMCADGRIRAVYSDRIGEFVRISGRKSEEFFK